MIVKFYVILENIFGFLTSYLAVSKTTSPLGSAIVYKNLLLIIIQLIACIASDKWACISKGYEIANFIAAKVLKPTQYKKTNP